MTYRNTTLLLTMALSVLCAAALVAQDEDYKGYPAERVRQQRTDSHVPDPLYPQNRVIIRQTKIMPIGGTGMQITGEIVTDFDADRIPPGEDLPRGQLEGVKVRVELYHYETVLERDRNGQVKMPKLDATEHGLLIEGQSQIVEIDRNFGPYGMATFTLPPMSKPLAPGIYKLVAGVHFQVQTPKIRKAIKWCSGLYGAESEIIMSKNAQGTLESKTIFHQVMADEERHERWYTELVENIGKIEDVTEIWIGAVKSDGKYALVTPKQGTDRKPCNYVYWGLHHSLVSQVMKFENELDNVDEVVDADLEAKLKLEGATDEMKERWTEEAREEKARIRRDNPDLITTYGGRAKKEEEDMVNSAQAARLSVLEQIAAYQEYLTYKYWVLCDGVLTYAGWHSVNVPGYNAYDAIAKQDARAGKIERIERHEAVKDSAEGLEGKWNTRKEQWKYQPNELTKYAFAYLRTKEERDTWDAEKFTKTAGDKLVLDVKEWAKFRNEFMSDFIELTDKLLQEVTTTNLYHNQTWPKALSEAQEARDEVIALAYSWEFYMRTEQMNEPKESVTKSWQDQANQNPTMRLDRYFKGAAYAPGTIKNRFDGHVNLVKSKVKLANFSQRFRVAIDNGAEGADLPGARPPSAPEELVK